MKLLLIDVNGNGSSTGKIVHDLYTYVNNNGNEAAICFGRGDKIEEKNVFKFGLDWETYLHALLTRLTGYTGCFSFFSTRRLLAFIKKYKPDVVHIHELHAYFVNLKPLLNYLKKNRIKTMMTLHCEFIYTGKCGHSYECTKWQIECGDCPHLHDYVSTLFFDHTKQMFLEKKKLLKDFPNLIIVTPSQWLAERTMQSFLKGHEIKVIRNGVDTAIFYPRDTSELRKKYNIASDEKVIVSIAAGLMDESKGGKYVLELAKRLRGEKVRFILVGVDDVSKNEEDNVIMLQRTNDKDELARYYSIADLFLICSKKENYPTTCLEAQACGTPVYGFDTGGTKETSLFPDNHFVEYANINQLLELITNEKIKSQKSIDEIHHLAEEKLSVKKSVEQYFSLYKRISG